MSKELELLQEIKDIVVLFKTRNTIYMGGEKSETFSRKNTIGNEFKGIFEIVEKSLKALEIIKPLCEVIETPVKKFRYLKANGVVVYTFKTEEEFNLLKEVLE